jgi:hypothetical protein
MNDRCYFGRKLHGREYLGYGGFQLDVFGFCTYVLLPHQFNKLIPKLYASILPRHMHLAFPSTAKPHQSGIC